MIGEAGSLIESRTPLRPTIGVVLGSGLGAFADELTERTEIPYGEIPSWPGSTAVGRKVAQIAGKYLKPALLELGGKAPLLVLYSPTDLVFPAPLVEEAARAVAAGGTKVETAQLAGPNGHVNGVVAIGQAGGKISAFLAQ